MTNSLAVGSNLKFFIFIALRREDDNTESESMNSADSEYENRRMGIELWESSILRGSCKSQSMGMAVWECEYGNGTYLSFSVSPGSGWELPTLSSAFTSISLLLG